MFSGFCVIFFKLSELVEKHKVMSGGEIALFVAKAFFTQVASSVFYASMFFPACKQASKLAPIIVLHYSPRTSSFHCVGGLSLTGCLCSQMVPRSS